MGVTEEIIVARIRAINDGFSKVVDKVKQELGGLNSVANSSLDRMKKMTTKSGEMNRNFAESHTVLGRFMHRLKLSTHGLRGFRMEMLGVMFFGQMLQKTFAGLLQPAAEAYGIFDLWGATLLVVFLPVMELLAPMLIGFMTWLMDLGPGMKLAIGLFTLFGLVLAIVLGIMGAFALGIGSFLLTAFIPALVITMAIFYLVIGVAMLFKKKLEGLGLILIAFGAILVAFNIWWAWIPLVVGLAAFLVMHYWKPIVHFFKNLWWDVKIIFLQSIDFILSYIQMFVNWMAKIPIIGSLFQGMSSGIDTARASIGNWIDETKKTQDAENAAYTLANSMKVAESATTKAGTGMMSTFGSMASGVTGSMTGMNKSVTTGTANMDTSFMNGYAGMNKTTQTGGANLTSSWGEVLKTMYKDTSMTVDAINKKFEGIGFENKNITNRESYTMSTMYGVQSVQPNLQTGTFLSTVQDIFGITPEQQDFMWRPGSAPISFSPNDTIIGTKSGMGAGGVNLTQNISVNVSDKSEFERMLNAYGRALVDDIKRYASSG